MAQTPRFGPHGPFDGEERRVILEVIDGVRRAGKPGAAGWIEALIEKVDHLERLGEVVDAHPSLLETQSVGTRQRSLETLVDRLSRAHIANLDIYLPTRALLGRDLVMAEVNFYRLLRLVCLESLDPPEVETRVAQVERLLCHCLYARLAEEVLEHIASDEEVGANVRRKAVRALVRIWDRTTYRIQDVFPILQATWEARRRVPAQLGTLMGTAELFGLLREGGHPAFIDCLAGQAGEDEAAAFREFLLGARTEDLHRLERTMRAEQIPCLGRDEAREVIELSDAWDPLGDPAISMFEFFRRRHLAAAARRLMDLPGPKRTAEEYVMLHYLEEEAKSGPREVEVRRVPARHYVGIRRRVRPPELGRALAEILPAVAEWLAEKGCDPEGPPTTFYHVHDEAAGEFEVQGGFFVSRLVPAEGRFESGTIPAGEVASTMHVGAYDSLGDTHRALGDWVRRRGRDTIAPCWETYWSDPGEVQDPAELRTEVVWPLAEAGS